METSAQRSTFQTLVRRSQQRKIQGIGSLGLDESYPARKRYVGTEFDSRTYHHRRSSPSAKHSLPTPILSHQTSNIPIAVTSPTIANFAFANNQGINLNAFDINEFSSIQHNSTRNSTPKPPSSRSSSNLALELQKIQLEQSGNERQQTPTYDVTSRDSTPDVMINAKQWIERIEGLQKSINYLDNTFRHEEWRQNNILDGRYWRIEADYWESCYANSLNDEYKPDRSWQEEDHLRNQQAQSNICFFRDISQFNWLSIYTQLTTKPSAVAEDKSPGLVFDITYHCHRASYWANLHEERGNTLVRKGIEALYYWQTEFTYLHHELLRLERKPLDTKSKPSQRVGVAKRRKNARTPSNGGDEKSSRSRVRDRRPAKAGNLR
ncbi:hypothetical protein DL98DRAFT_660728, partial [Cadophora sp. DSE1049]